MGVKNIILAGEPSTVAFRDQYMLAILIIIFIAISTLDSCQHSTLPLNDISHEQM